MRTRLQLLLALAAATLLAALGAAPALAASNEIAYRCDADICLVDPDNPGAITNLTANGSASLDERPVWSPDGARVAFVSRYSANTRNVFVMEPDAAGQGVNLAVQVTHFEDGGYLNDPVWSPDGTKIAFVRGADEGSRSVRVAAANGTTAIPLLIAEHGQHPSWAPDGGKIAYSYGKQVYLRNADASGSATPLANAAGREPAWSPDGTFIAFDFPAHPAEFVDLHVVSSTGGGTPTVVVSDTQWTYAEWSPDSSKLAYRSTSSNAGYIRVVNANGSGDHPLASLASVNVNSPPSWSPDGSRVVFYGLRFSPSTSDDIYLANTDGSGAMQPLISGSAYEPDWRPNPLVSPHVPVVTPSGGSGAPLPATAKPKVVWITKRIHWTPGLNPNLNIGNYACYAPTCGVVTEGKAKSVSGPSIRPRPASASAKPKGKGRPKDVVVGRGKMTVPGGKTRPLKMKLTAKGIGLLQKLGKLSIKVTVTTTSPGQAKVRQLKTVTVVLDKPAKPKR